MRCLPGKVERPDLPAPVAQDDREDLSVGARLGAGPEEALPGALVRGLEVRRGLEVVRVLYPGLRFEVPSLPTCGETVDP
jgi:hypothetical protein